MSLNFLEANHHKHKMYYRKIENNIGRHQAKQNPTQRTSPVQHLLIFGLPSYIYVCV